MSTCQVTRDLDTFKKGLSLHGAKARRCLLTTGHLLEVLQEVKASEMRIKECCQLQKIFLANDEVLAKGSAWQLRVPDSDADTGTGAGPSAIDISLSVRNKKSTGWGFLFLEVNWDYHIRGVRFLWKESSNPSHLRGAIDNLQTAIQALAKMNRTMRQMAEACYEPMPPLPEDYPSQLHVSDTWTDEPVVVWLIPFWEAGDEPQQSRSVRPRRDTESESVTARLNRLTSSSSAAPAVAVWGQSGGEWTSWSPSSWSWWW